MEFWRDDGLPPKCGCSVFCISHRAHQPWQRHQQAGRLLCQRQKQFFFAELFRAKTSQLKKFFSISRDNKKPEQPVSDSESTVEAVVPSLGHLKQFSCGRDTGGSLANVFQDSLWGDSTCSPTNKSEDSGDEKRSASDDWEVENPRNEDRSKKKSPMLISHSGSLLSQPLPKPSTTDGQPCEINLWKRRSVAPPMALNLKRSYGLEMGQPSTA
jgi:hypothetical protein